MSRVAISKPMSKDVLQLSQIVGTFGPGAMVDLPDRLVMISGLDNREMGARGAFRMIEERRLVELLEQRLQGDPRIAQGKPLSLRTPPIDPGLLGAGQVPGVPATIFPTWFTCGTVEAGTPADEGPDRRDGGVASGPRRRRIVQWTNLDPPQRRKYRDDGGKAHDVTPLRSP
jgi:hypothetical protein